MSKFIHGVPTECLHCLCWDYDDGCSMPSTDAWYACPLESKEPQNVERLYEMTAFYAGGTLKRVYEHYQFAKNLYGNRLVGVFLYGSQNYKLDTEYSDVDTKCIILPTIEDIIHGNQLQATEHHLPNGEHCEAMDIRHYIRTVKKQNVNFVELLFTEYNFINPIWTQQFNKYFTKNREKIAFYNKKRGIQSICEQVLHSLKMDGAPGKRICEGLFLKHFIESYLKRDSGYLDCLVAPEEERQKMIEYKLNASRDDPELRRELLEFFSKTPFDLEKIERPSYADEVDKLLNDCATYFLKKVITGGINKL